MQTVAQTYKPAVVRSIRRQSVIAQFLNWCDKQEATRFGWTAAIIALHGCLLTPITVATIALTSNQMALWGVAIGAMGVSLITNLSAMPTKVTIPVFILSALVDVSIIIACFSGINS